MKILSVEPNARKKLFLVRTRRGEYQFPYAKLRLVPTSEDPVDEVFPDPEVGNEGFTYRLRSGAEDTVPLDAVLDFNQDPDYLRDLFLHQLTVEALEGLEESGLGIRQLSRQLGTSPSQVYRLLDPTNYRKSVGQMLALLHMLDRKVEVTVTSREAEVAQSSTSP